MGNTPSNPHTQDRTDIPGSSHTTQEDSSAAITNTLLSNADPASPTTSNQSEDNSAADFEVLDPPSTAAGNSELTTDRIEKMKANLECPITLELMHDPVQASDGYTYEREAIEAWLASGRTISPMTGTTIDNPNLLLTNQIAKQQIALLMEMGIERPPIPSADTIDQNIQRTVQKWNPASSFCGYGGSSCS